MSFRAPFGSFAHWFLVAWEALKGFRKHSHCCSPAWWDLAHCLLRAQHSWAELSSPVGDTTDRASLLSMLPGPAALALPESLLEIQSLAHPRDLLYQSLCFDHIPWIQVHGAVWEGLSVPDIIKPGKLPFRATKRCKTSAAYFYKLAREGFSLPCSFGGDLVGRRENQFKAWLMRN